LRKIISMAAAALIAVTSLTGCSAAAAKVSTALDAPMVCKHFVTGSTADQITAKVPATGEPTLSFPTPLTTTKSETKVLVAGTGPRFGGAQQITFEYQSYNAGTGAKLQGTKWDGTDAVSQVVAKAATGSANFCDALAGVREGSVVATIISAKDSHGGKAYPTSGIGKNDSIIFVFKLLKVFLPKAQGTQQPAEDGFPQVVTNADGAPGLVMANWDASAAPTDFKSETLIQGKGPTIKMGDTVTVHYSGYIWSTAKTMFDSSWSKGTPATFQLQTGALIPGFIKALVGQHVGSQVVAVLPPAYGYGTSGAGSIPANSTLIFVIDILGKGK
jgi:peptidylprolyl isomerase